MSREALVRYLIGGSAALLATGFLLLALGAPMVAAALLLAGFPLLAIAMSQVPALKGFSFTCWIFAAVVVAMLFPQAITSIGGFQTKRLILPLLQLIMFGVGSTMGWRDFEGIIRMPKGVFVGVVCQFTIMPLVGYGIAKTFNFPPEVAAGIILVGSVPSGLASNVMSYIANANVALSVTLTAVATLLAPVMTPLLMQALAGEYVPVNFVSMMLDIFQIVMLPIGAGLLFHHFFSQRFPLVMKAMPLLSMVSIAAIITVITANGRESLLVVGPLLVLACLLHNLLGYILGYLACKALRMDEKSCRTVALEVGLQNSGLASGLALQMGRVATVGLAPAVFGPLMNITGSSLATWWHNRKTDA